MNSLVATVYSLSTTVHALGPVMGPVVSTLFLSVWIILCLPCVRLGF